MEVLETGHGGGRVAITDGPSLIFMNNSIIMTNTLLRAAGRAMVDITTAGRTIQVIGVDFDPIGVRYIRVVLVTTGALVTLIRTTWVRWTGLRDWWG